MNGSTHNSSADEILATARRYIDAGLSVIPIATDGTKSPAWEGLPKEYDPVQKRDKHVWKPFQTRMPIDTELQEWARRKYGIAFVCGKSSGGLEVLDNDDVPLWKPYVELVKLHAPDLWQRLTIIETPSEGHHMPFRCDTIEGNQPLARRPRLVEVAAGTKGAKEKDGKWYVEKFDILFETRGEGGYIVAPGSPLAVHPTGKPYRFIKGSLDTIPTITADERALLFNLARAFDECKATDKAKASAKPGGKLRPGDDYDLRGNIEQDLLNHGWEIERRAGMVAYLRKPGKGNGHQATLHAVGPNVFWCFSTSAAPFEANKPYSPFQVYAILEHNGDFTAAAHELATQGYGPQVKASSNSSAPKATAKAQTGSKTLPKPTDDALRDRWLKANPDTIFARDDFFRYDAGLWKPLAEPMVRKEIDTIVCAARREGIRPTNSLVSSVYGLAKNRAAIADTQLDMHTDYLVCRNGVLHIPTRTLGPHRKELYCTTGVNFDYDPSAQTPAWDHYLEWFVLRYGGDAEEVVEFMQEYAGLCITPDMKYELCLWLVGPPGGGKSTFIEGIRATLSDRTIRLGLNEISQRFGLSNLAGKTLATCSEQPSDYLQSTEILNSIISGETVTVERKYHHPYEINPTVKLLWAMNDPPRISDPNNGIFRRVRIIRFPALDDADKDETLKDRIKLEGPGILNWALDGLERLTRRGYFCIPLSVAMASKDYRAHADVPGVFLSECCERNPNPLDIDNPDYREQSSELYKAYSTWAKENGHRPVSSTRIADDWERLGLGKKRITGCTYWCGVRLIDFPIYGKP